jgi:hypothetical protein
VSVNPTDTPGVGGAGLSGEGAGAVSGAGGSTPFQNWIIESTQRTPWVRSQTSAIDAMRIGFATQPHGVEAFVMVPYATFQLEGPNLIVEPIAFGIEVILDIPAADAAWYIEDADASGLLRGFIEYLVSATPRNPAVAGPVTSSVVVPIGQVANYTAVQGLLDAERARLQGLPGV